MSGPSDLATTFGTIIALLFVVLLIAVHLLQTQVDHLATRITTLEQQQGGR